MYIFVFNIDKICFCMSMRKNRKRKNTLPFLVVNPNLPQGKK